MITRPIALAATLLLSPTLATAQNTAPGTNTWRAVTYSDLQMPNTDGLPYASLWADEIKKNNDAYTAKGDTRWAVANAPASESHIVVRSPVKAVVLSVLHTLTSCKTIRRDASANATLKSCPMRLAIYQDGQSSVSDAGTGCFIEYGTPPANAKIDLARNAAMGAYDIDTRTIRAGVVFEGAIAPECQFRVSVPQQ